MSNFLDFNEQDYLEMYIDVQGAVNRGQFINGLEHYERHGRGEGRAPNKLNASLSRSEKILYGINQNGLGLEIAPRHNPVAPKSKGFNVHILDFLDAGQIRGIYQNDPTASSLIEDVDFVWNGGALDEVLKTNLGKYDYIIASHVIEHIPNFVGFLRACTSLLSPRGVLALAIPNHPCCLDKFLPLTTTGDVLDAWIANRINPSPGQIFNFYANAIHQNQKLNWARGEVCEVMGLAFGYDEAVDQFNKADNTLQESLSIHCWTFIPESFKLIMSDLLRLNLLDLRLHSEFEADGSEFYISLNKWGLGYRAQERCLQLNAINHYR